MPVYVVSLQIALRGPFFIMAINADSRCYTKFDWLWRNAEPIIFDCIMNFSALMLSEIRKDLLFHFFKIECLLICSTQLLENFHNIKLIRLLADE